MLPECLQDFCSLNPWLFHENNGLKWHSNNEGKWICTNVCPCAETEHKKTCSISSEPTTLTIISSFLFILRSPNSWHHLLLKSRGSELNMLNCKHFPHLGLKHEQSERSMCPQNTSVGCCYLLILCSNSCPWFLHPRKRLQISRTDSIWNVCDKLQGHVKKKKITSVI